MKCSECLKDFTVLHQLVLHFISKHGKYKCHFCSRLFHRISHAEAHMHKRHTARYHASQPPEKVRIRDMIES